MERKRQPDPRFQQFTETLDQNGKAIGFTIPGSTFLFKYDEDGGWVDQDDNYYNHEGILQSDSEYEDDDEEDDSLSDRDDDLVDEFEDILRQEEQGIVRNPPKEEKQPKHQVEQQAPKKKQTDFDFKTLLEKYNNKQHMRQNLPGELFIYFKQKSKYFEEIQPSVESKQSVDDKNKQIKEKILVSIEQKRQSILKQNQWLNQPGVSLEYSGECEDDKIYERYWYGSIRTVPDKYLQYIQILEKSKNFNLLAYKTFYALKSKFYLKKAEQKVKKHIQQITQKVQKMQEDEVILMRFDNLPQNYPLSFVYDLIDFVGGKWQDIQEAHAIDQFSAELSVLKGTALKMANLQAYNHDKGEYVELSVKEVTKRKSKPQKRFYWIQVEGGYKYHEHEVCDTIGLIYSKQQLAKHLSLEEFKSSSKKIRFVVGSVTALRKVLMFRGSSLNTIHVYPDQS